MKTLLKSKLPEELYTQVVDVLGDDIDFVPRSRLNEVIGKRDELKDQLASIKVKADAYDDVVAKKTALEAALADAKAQHATELAEREQLVSQIKIESAVKEKLLLNKVKNPTAAMALLKADAFGEDLSGLDAEIARVKESDPYLFGETIPAGTGKTDGEPGGAALGEAEQLQAQYDDAMKRGDTISAIALKNKLFKMNKK